MLTKEKKLIQKKYFQNNLDTNIKSNLKLFIIFIFIIIHNIKKDVYKKISSKEIDYKNNTFIIIRRPCKMGGLFSFYKVFLSCMLKFIIEGYIPILEVESYPTIFNGFKANSSSINPWEYFFNQPFNYKLENVLKNAKKIKYYNCKREHSTPQYHNFYSKKISIDFWHNFGKTYIPIKNEIIKELNNIMKILFKGSNNILGVLIRGTDYLAKKPKKHPIPPSCERIINDIKEMDTINSYNWIFVVTEDIKIREKIINKFKEKIKYIKPKIEINYNYKSKKYLAFNKNLKGNLDNLKIYLINILILSKCIDIITARTNGSIGAFIFTEGFRNIKVYYLGLYP